MSACSNGTVGVSAAMNRDEVRRCMLEMVKGMPAHQARSTRFFFRPGRDSPAPINQPEQLWNERILSRSGQSLYRISIRSELADHLISGHHRFELVGRYELNKWGPLVKI